MASAFLFWAGMLRIHNPHYGFFRSLSALLTWGTLVTLDGVGTSHPTQRRVSYIHYRQRMVVACCGNRNREFAVW